MSLTRACLGVAGSEAKAPAVKARSSVSAKALKKQQSTYLLDALDAFDIFDLPLSAHIVPH
jgi:hypothetical protein